MTHQLPDPLNEQLLDLLRRYALLKGNFALASGEVTDTYLDVRRLALTGEGAAFLGERITDFVESRFPVLEGFGGMSIGADPLVTSACISYSKRSGSNVSGILVRKTPKPHGSHDWLLGCADLTENAPILLLEDVVTSGSSSLTAARRIRKAGYSVKACLCVVDREAGGAETLAKEGIALYSLTTLEKVLEE